MGQLFECECLSVISTIFKLQFTNHSWKSCFEFSQRNGTWPSVKLLNSTKGTVDLHGVYGCRGHNLQRNIQWWCESWCDNRRTPLINPSKWTLMYHWCSVTWTWILGRSYTGWWWRCRRLMVLSWRSWAQRNRLKWLCVTSYMIPWLWLSGNAPIIQRHGVVPCPKIL